MKAHTDLAHASRLVAMATLLVAVWLILQPSSALAADDAEGDIQALLPLVAASRQPVSPAFVSEPVRTAAVGKVYTYAVEVSGYPKPELSISYGPVGMSVDEDGLVQWTPTTTDTQGVVIVASNGVLPDAEQFYEIEVALEPFAPDIVSTPVLSAAVGVNYAYQVQVIGYPEPEITLDPLVKPEGMTIDNRGLITWMPASTGAYSATVRAANGIDPDAEQPFTIAVSETPIPAPPLIASQPEFSATVGITYTYQVVAYGYPTPTIELDGGPAGMMIDTQGLVQWIPEAAGVSTVTVRAHNGESPDAVQSFSIQVTPQPSAPSITSTPVTTATASLSYTYQVAVTGYPTPTLALDAKPEGMTIDDGGMIQWTPAAAGEYSVTVRATNGILPDAEQSYTIDVLLPARIWDPQLDQRYAYLDEAEVESGDYFWRLVEAQWFDEDRNRVYIDMEILDESGQRAVGEKLLVFWADGADELLSEENAEYEYAASFPMYNLAPAYSARPNTGLPADTVHGLGLGSIEAPDKAIHSSYLLTWQLTKQP